MKHDMKVVWTITVYRSISCIRILYTMNDLITYLITYAVINARDRKPLNAVFSAKKIQVAIHDTVLFVWGLIGGV
jgi:hypothetical protein